jgi:hypothetical protein
MALAAIATGVLALGWNGVTFIGAFCLANIALKLFHPANTVMRDIRWSVLLITSVVVLAGVFLIDNPTVLGGWTLIVVFLLFLVYGLGSLIVWARSQARSLGERHDEPH